MTNEIKNFLNTWKEESITYYTNELANLKEGIEKKYDAMTINLSQMSTKDANEYLIKAVEKEAASKEKSLLERIEKLTGEITNTELFVGYDGNLNGFVTGENATVKVETILAGGAVQKPHYRVLVNTTEQHKEVTKTETVKVEAVSEVVKTVKLKNGKTLEVVNTGKEKKPYIFTVEGETVMADLGKNEINKMLVVAKIKYGK